MIRYCLLCIWLFTYVFQTEAQVQTLHNTLAKGTLNSTFGLHFKGSSDFTFLASNNFVFGINYCFKHHYTFGVESNYTTLKHLDFSPGAAWTSNNLLVGINIQRNDHLLKTKMGKFKIASILTIGGGSVFSNDELIEKNQTKKSAFNPTGFYTNFDAGLRLEFFRRIFIELKESGGYLVKNNVNLRLNNQKKISTKNWYTETQIKLGIFMFINTLDKCGTCPKW
jgi:hypothetical protein